MNAWEGYISLHKWMGEVDWLNEIRGDNQHPVNRALVQISLALKQQAENEAIATPQINQKRRKAKKGKLTH